MFVSLVREEGRRQVENLGVIMCEELKEVLLRQRLLGLRLMPAS